jgi:hypothetical protein
MIPEVHRPNTVSLSLLFYLPHIHPKIHYGTNKKTRDDYKGHCAMTPDLMKKLLVIAEK